MLNLRLLVIGLVALLPIAGLSELLQAPPALSQPLLIASADWNPIRAALGWVTNRPRKKGGDKGPFDLISPGVWVSRSAASGSPVQIWHPQPMLIWQSDGMAASRPDQVEVVDSSTSKVIWSQTITADRYVAQPISARLQPGKQYQIRLLKRNPETQTLVVITRPITIQLLSAQLARAVEEQLNRAEATAKLNQATTIELTQKRIEVFVQNGLWSDALQALNSAALPPEARQTLTQEVVRRWGQRSN
jgi:hypothetical protein